MFYLSAFTIPLEVTTVTSLLLLAAALFQPRVCFRRPPQAFWCFAAYLYILALSSLATGGEHQRAAARLLSLLTVQLLAFWVTANVMRYEETAARGLWALVAGCAVISLLQVSGLGVTRQEIMSGAVRLSALGQNANSLARALAAGTLALMGLTYDLRRRPTWMPLMAPALCGLFGLSIILSGSRMGILALGVGLLTFTLRPGSGWIKLRNGAIVAAVAAFCLWQISHTASASARFERTIEEGSLAQREIIYPAAWEMVMERPLFGWGPATNMWELGARIGDRAHRFRDTHNLALELLTSVGIAGMIPFVAGILLCLRTAWRARGGPLGILPLAMMAAMLTANVSGNLLGQKLFWFVMAVAAAGICRVAPARLRKNHIVERESGRPRAARPARQET